MATLLNLQIELEDVRPTAAHCDAQTLTVTLADGRSVTTPLWWYPRLLNASPVARVRIELTPMGVHWPEIDEDISVASMLRGAKAPGARPPGL